MHICHNLDIICFIHDLGVIKIDFLPNDFMAKHQPFFFFYRKQIQIQTCAPLRTKSLINKKEVEEEGENQDQIGAMHVYKPQCRRYI